MTLLDKLGYVDERLRAFGDTAVPFDTVIEAAAGRSEVIIDGRRTLMCGSNNYFGLSFHPDVIAASRAALEQYGSATTGSRAANGTLALHRDLERELAAFYTKRHALVFTTGYQANLGVIAGLCGAEDVVLLDVDSHASIYDGARLSGAQIFAFRHNSPGDLARKLARQPHGSRCLVVVEGLYSIGGDVAPLADIVAVTKAAGAFLVVDEAHSFGAYGDRGLGCAEAQGVLDDVDFIVGTFSKTLAGVGGFCVSDHAALKALHFTARSYVFTASGSPSNMAGVQAALAIVRTDSSLRDGLWENVRRVRAGLSRIGYRIGSTESPIVPIEIGSPERTVEVWQALLAAGLYTNIVLPPACRPDACLLRTSYSAAHTAADIDRALAIFEQVGRELGVVETAASL
jgi:8-amino-7-oxononanoate synthase